MKTWFCKGSNSSPNNPEILCKSNKNPSFLVLVEFLKLILKFTYKCKGLTSLPESKK